MSPRESPVGGGRTHLGRAGFETGADTYERARPGYPDPAVAHLGSALRLGAGSRVLDVAAGTGKLTRHLAADGMTCLALEPSASMRRVFRRVSPAVPVVAGTAEMIPVVTGAFDAVVVAQAFHWFDPARALAEFSRVLRPGGGLALVWNERDETHPTVAELTRISKWDRCQPYPVGRDFGTDIDHSGLFGPVERTRFPFVQLLSLDDFVGQVASRSYIQVLPEPDRRAVLDRVEAFGATLGEPIEVPYVTDLFRTRSPG